MNRLSEYIKNSTAARDSLKEARIKHHDGNDRLALYHLMDALDSFMRATNCAVSIREKVKPRASSRVPSQRL